MVLSRRGIELPVSMIIVLIISIIVLGLAGGLTYKIVCTSEDAITTADAQQVKNVERALATGPAVIIPDATKSADQPSSLCGGDSRLGAVYTIGVRNDDDAEHTFTIDCWYKGIDAADSPVACSSLIQVFPTVTIPAGERRTLALAAKIDANTPKGRNVYTLNVYDTTDGGTINKNVNFYLDVS